MGFQSDDVVPMNQVRVSFTELAEQVRHGREKLITRNGESYVALIDARPLAITTTASSVATSASR